MFTHNKQRIRDIQTNHLFVKNLNPSLIFVKVSETSYKALFDISTDVWTYVDGPRVEINPLIDYIVYEIEIVGKLWQVLGEM